MKLYASCKPELQATDFPLLISWPVFMFQYISLYAKSLCLVAIHTGFNRGHMYFKGKTEGQRQQSRIILERKPDL